MDIPITDGPPPGRGEPSYRAELAGAKGKDTVIDEVVSLLTAEEGLGNPEVFRLRLCLDEALQNAMIHGHRNDPRKPIRLQVFRLPESWEIRVTDEGPGFDPSRVPDPRTADGLEKESGRGILILRECMDGVRYFDGGRTLALTLLSRQRVE